MLFVNMHMLIINKNIDKLKENILSENLTKYLLFAILFIDKK